MRSVLELYELRPELGGHPENMLRTGIGRAVELFCIAADVMTDDLGQWAPLALVFIDGRN
jgi:hypothetical protein